MLKKKRWTGYYDAVANQPARESLLTALDYWDAVSDHTPGFAIDLGCGSGRDTMELLHRGWRVLAIDKEREAIQRLMNDLSADVSENLTTLVSPFEELVLPPSQLINASFSLPFCLPNHFDALWQQIVDSLAQNGFFAGQLFGDRDSWATNDGITFHSRQHFDERFAGFDLLHLTEVDKDGSTATGQEKHWHYFEVVAKKV